MYNPARVCSCIWSGNILQGPKSFSFRFSGPSASTCMHACKCMGTCMHAYSHACTLMHPWCVHMHACSMCMHARLSDVCWGRLALNIFLEGDPIVLCWACLQLDPWRRAGWDFVSDSYVLFVDVLKVPLLLKTVLTILFIVWMCEGPPSNCGKDQRLGHTVGIAVLHCYSRVFCCLGHEDQCFPLSTTRTTPAAYRTG